MIEQPQIGFIGRMNIYFSEMFPIPQRFIQAILIYTSFTIGLSWINSTSFHFFSLNNVLGIWSVFMILLILRLMDEIKDKEIDKKLFFHRPLPSGKVLEKDVVFSLVVAIFLFLLPNILTSKTFWGALLVLIYSLLMFKYFFIPKTLNRYLLLNLATHTPIIPLMLVYLVNVYLSTHELQWGHLDLYLTVLLISQYWLLFFSWEIVRKIRSQEEENAYVTYSQIFGRIGAIFLSIFLQILALSLGVYFQSELNLSEIFLTILGIGFIVLLVGYFRFIIKPNPSTSKLKIFTEGFILCTFLAIIAEQAFIR